MLHRTSPTHSSATFLAGPRSFRIEADEAPILTAIEADLRDLAAPADHTPIGSVAALQVRRDPSSHTHPWIVSRDGEICQTVTDEYLRPYVLWEVTRLLLEAPEPTLAIHAGAVALAGRAIVIAGVSHTGKSTLSGWLVAHGWGFLTDEVSRVEADDDGWLVHPFPRPIGVRRPTPLEPFIGPELGRGSEILVPASTVGRLAGTARLEAIILPSRTSSGLVPAGLVPAHPASAARLLGEHLPKRAADGRAGFRTLIELVQSVPVYSLEVDDLAVAEQTLRELVS